MSTIFCHLYLGPETEWRQQPAAMTQAFPTSRSAVAYIVDTFPIRLLLLETEASDHSTPNNA